MKKHFLKKNFFKKNVFSETKLDGFFSFFEKEKITFISKENNNEINFYYTMLHDLYTTPNQLIHICHKSIHMYINTY